MASSSDIGPSIIVLGVGNILFTDEGFGVRALEALDGAYVFPENVSLFDGGVLGIHLLSVIAEAEHLIVLDAVRNGGVPGTLYRLTDEDIPKRVLAKNSLHQIDLLDALTLCRALDKAPVTVILGVEPVDIQTTGITLTPLLQKCIPAIVAMTLEELDRLGVHASLQGRRDEAPPCA